VSPGKLPFGESAFNGVTEFIVFSFGNGEQKREADVFCVVGENKHPRAHHDYFDLSIKMSALCIVQMIGSINKA
jgi:hypothetical protein